MTLMTGEEFLDYLGQRVEAAKTKQVPAFYIFENGRTERHRFEWNGILLEVTYKPQWLSSDILGEDVAHLLVQSIYPIDAPLPSAKFGFFSCTVRASTVAAVGGPVNYVGVLLEAEDATA